MEIKLNNVILRDYILDDVDDEIRWMNEERAWMKEDMPWADIEPANPNELRLEMISMMAHMPANAIRWRLEIQVDGKHVGFVSSYLLDENLDLMDCTHPTGNGNAVRALGIEICEPAYWHKGIGYEALKGFMKYYSDLGEFRFAIETWSGHKAMLGLAKKLGFTESRRNPHAYEVAGTWYDAVVLEGQALGR